MALTNLRELSEHDRRGLMLKHRLDNAIGRVNYPYFASQILGYGRIANDPRNPGNFEQFNDPRVQENLVAVGNYFTSWLRHRGEQASFRKVLIVQPRGTCKSATCTIPLPIWAHLHDSEMAAAIISATQDDMAKGKFGKATRNTFEGADPHSRLTDLYGIFQPKGAGKEWRTDKMTTVKRKNVGRGDPTYLASSVEKGLTSGHFDMVIIDDPITQEKMQGDKEWLNKVWQTYVRLPYVLNRNGLLIVIMTRYHDADLCGRVIREEVEPAVLKKFDGKLPPDFNYEQGWIKYAGLAGWEVRYDSVYEDYDVETKRGRVVYPVCWSHEKIAQSRLTPEGERDFWFDLMNTPAKREDQPVTEEHVRKCWMESLDEMPPQALHAVDMHCDFSFKNEEAFKKQTGDYGVIQVVAKYNGHVYRIDGFRGKLRQHEFGNEIVRLVRKVHHELKTKVRYISYDAPTTHGAGDHSTNEWIYGLFRLNPDLPQAAPKALKRSLGSGHKKVGRVLDTAWAWQQGYVHLLRGSRDVDALVYQILNLGSTPHDDDIDAFSDAFHKSMYDAPPVFGSYEEDEAWEKTWTPAVQIEAEDPWDEHIGFGA
jgi:hypothetical protein